MYSYRLPLRMSGKPGRYTGTGTYPDWAVGDQVAQGRVAVRLVLHLHRWLLATSIELLLLRQQDLQVGYGCAWLLICWRTACYGRVLSRLPAWHDLHHCRAQVEIAHVEIFKRDSLCGNIVLIRAYLCCCLSIVSA